jgi:hypothetical protein
MPFERAIGRMLIQSFVPSGFSANAIINMVRRAGYSYRRKEMLSDIRLFSGRFKYEDAVRSVGSNEIVPIRYMNETDLKRENKYMLHGDAVYFDTETGEYITRDVSFYTDRLITTGEWERDAIEYSMREETDPRYILENVHFKAVDHQVGYSY